MILVTGATGMLGSHLAFALCSQGHKIRASVRHKSSIEKTRAVFKMYTSNPDAILQNMEWVEVDLFDIQLLDSVFEGIHKVYHCAAEVSFNPRKRRVIIQNNKVSARNVVDCCLKHKVEKLCHVSSIAALGNKVADEMLTENHFWVNAKNRSAYSESKYLSEMEVWRGIAEGLNAVIVNPSVILGPGNWDSGSPSFFKWIDQGLKFYTNGGTGFVDVNDVVKCMIGLMESPVSGERFILNSENISYRHFFQTIAASIGKKAPFIEAKPWMLSLAWRIEALRSKIFRAEPKITRQTAKTSFVFDCYCNDKVVSKSYDFIPVASSIKRIADIYLKNNY